jgi:DNA-binding LacI/PurR family transcriptional regulator
MSKINFIHENVNNYMTTKKTTHPATIYDVAQKSKVSIATVSRVLNKKDSLVTEKTRVQVLQAIKDLHFKPNLSARRLVSNRTNLIEVFFHINNFPLNFKNDWYNGILVGTTQVIQKNNMGLLINFLIGIPDPQEIVDRIFYNNVDGVLMIAPSLEEKHLLELSRQSTPIVMVGHRAQNPEISFVDTNNIEASETATEHLIGLGHKKIACLAGPTHNIQNAKDRLEGFQKAMSKHGLFVPKNFMVSSEEFIQQNGYDEMKKLLKLSEKPTAVYCCNDMLAMGAWDAVIEAGLKVGKDISIVGYDDIPAVSTAPYSLTTIRQDVEGLSAAATRLLISQIKSTEGFAPSQQYESTKLIIRSSTGPAPK